MKRELTLLSVGAAALVLAACGNREREAEADTGIAEAEVTTTLPEEAISDEELKRTAQEAAAGASTAPVAIVTAPSQNAAPAAGTTTTAPASGTTTAPVQ